MSRKAKGNNVNAKGRDKYDKSQYLLLPYRLITSPQFRGLHGNEVRVLLEICSRHNGFNNGRIGAGMTDLANTLKMSKTTVRNALLSLQAFKFIKCQKKGQFFGRLASEWEVTFLKSQGLRPSNEWAQQKTRKQKRRKPSKTFLQELADCPEALKQEEERIKVRYQNETCDDD